MNDPIAAAGLRKNYGEIRALDGIDFHVPQGAFVLLVGRNGAGKSTLLRALSGQTFAEGTLLVLGSDPRRHPGQPNARLAYRGERPTLPARFRIRDVLDLYSRVHPRFDRRCAEHHLVRADIRNLDLRLDALSQGTLARVEAAFLLASDAELILLDEPLAGLDPLYRDLFWREFLAEYVEGRTVVLVTHRPEDVAQLFTHLAVFDSGRLTLFEEAEQLRRRYRAVLVSAERKAEAAALHPLFVRPHWGRDICLFRDPPEDLASHLGEEIPLEIPELVQALMTPSSSAGAQP